MGKYDGPDFDREGVVSIWIGTRPWNDPEWPEDYCVPNYGGDDDEQLCDFTTDFGFDHFDLDKTESNYSDDGLMVDLELLLNPLSYSPSYGEKAVAEAKRNGLATASAAWLIFDFAYDPRVTGIVQSRFLRFLGSFEYDLNS
jgi:hypothetical protein